MRILVIEDYPPLRGSIVAALRDQGWAVDQAGDGRTGLELASGPEPFDVLILDLGLPELGGMEVLEGVRDRSIESHVLVLTARRAVQTRVEGLDRGADDFVTKPFAMAELVARVRALGRRLHGRVRSQVEVGPLCVDAAAREARVAGELLELTPREYSLLEYLAARESEVVTKAELCRHAFDGHIDESSNAVEVYIGYLRKKLARAGCPPLIHTRRGRGYVLAGDTQNTSAVDASSAADPPG